MSGYFSNLLARHRGTADLVAPRLASLFEPVVPKWTGSDWEDNSETVEEIAAEQTESATERQPSVTRHTQRRPRPRIADPVLEVSANTAEIQREGASPDAVRANALPDTRPAGSASRDVLRARTATPSAELDAPQPAARTERRAGTTRPPTHSVEGAALGAHPTREQERVRSANKAVMRERIREVVSDVPVRKGSILGLSAPLSAIKAPRFIEARPVMPEPPSAEPTVQVTIGRIEVRAVSEPSSHRKERGPSAVMSLEEYLNARKQASGR